MMPGSSLKQQDQQQQQQQVTSRNLFVALQNNRDLTFRDANLYPRIFLLIQENWVKREREKCEKNHIELALLNETSSF